MLLFLVIQTVWSLPTRYHTSNQINEKLESLTQQCNFIELQNASESPLIKEVSVNKGTGKKYKGYILFGEHPRELISPESGLHFLQNLCSESFAEKNQKILENFELRMIMNANPLSRERVEQGEFCLRENEHGVDLNRNYDAHWKKIYDDVRQTTSGPNPFSEPETQAIRDSLKAFQPDLFLSVHSGTLGMYTPHAYSMEEAEVNDDQMVDILDTLQNKYCPSCDVGAAGKEVGYLSPGSCIDYAYDELKIRYSFAFEIYHGSIDLKEEVQARENPSFLQLNGQAKKPKKLMTDIHRSSCFLQTKTNGDMSNEQCFSYFNPTDKEYDWYVDNWSEAYKDMLLKMVAEEQQQ